MREITDIELTELEAALWWLGQAGYVVRTENMTVVIDPYLSDLAAENASEFTRLYPAPFSAGELTADVFIVTHDHLDHLDPHTVSHFIDREDTWFVAPRLAARKLASIGIAKERIVVLNSGERWKFKSMSITGVFALPTGADVLDTTGYLVEFDNGRSFYHTSDTEYHPIVVAAAPQKPEVMLVPINGKWGNPGPDTAALFARALDPKYVLPNHYDLMELNAENPRAFQWFCKQNGLGERCVLPERMKPFKWGN